MTQKKIDLSPEEAVAVLNQLLGHEREKGGLDLKVRSQKWFHEYLVLQWDFQISNNFRMY